MNTDDIPINYPEDLEMKSKLKRCRSCAYATHRWTSYTDGEENFCTAWNALFWGITERIENCNEFTRK